jgi:predicted ATPase/transcriptional regulator with XRE-family HTH domain
MAEAGSGNFGVSLRRLRLSVGLTQEALAERAGISAKAVGELERDPTRSPRLDTVTLLADALGLDVEGRTQLLAVARPGDVVPASPFASGGGLADFPRPLTPLFGREGVADAVAELVRRGERSEGSRLVVLTGPGGVGKTRLAIAVADQVTGAFSDGAVFVDLAPLSDPALVVATIAGRFAVDEREKVPLRDSLTAALRRKHLLLVLDNFEHLLPARDEVLALLEACPRLTVLATSRVALRVRGEREYRIAPLELPDTDSSLEALECSPAVALFLDRARAAGAELELTATSAPVVAEICRRLDGLPLAVELAAAWTRLLPPPALLARLDRRLPLLIDGPHDLPARQRTMRDTVAWSYGLLAAEERRLFRRLCVFVGGCTPEAAESICAEAVEEPGVLAGLAALVDRSLVRSLEAAEPGIGAPRVTIFETLREYGLGELESCGELEPMRRRHAAYYLALAEEAKVGLRGTEGVAWGRRLDGEHDNLRAALRWALASGERDCALRLAGAMTRFWADRGYLSEGRSWLREALDLPGENGFGDLAALVSPLIGAAHLAIDQSDFDEATARCGEAVRLAREFGMGSELLDALNTQGRLARERGEYSESIRHHEEALALARSLGDRLGEAVALGKLGYATTFGGDAARGADLAEQSLEILRALGDARALALALLGLADIISHTGRFARSEALAEEALALFRALGDTARVSDALWVLGAVALMQEQYERAVPLLEQNLALGRERGDERGTNQPLGALALIALRQGRYERARTMLEESLTILGSYDDRWARAMTLTLLGHVELAAGDPSRAEARFADAAPLFQALGNPLYVPWCFEGLAGVTAERGDWALAVRLCGARDALHAGLGLGVPPVDRNAHARTLDGCRRTLGGDAFAAAYEAGRALTLDDALAEAGIAVPGDTRS